MAQSNFLRLLKLAPPPLPKSESTVGSDSVVPATPVVADSASTVVAGSTTTISVWAAEGIGGLFPASRLRPIRLAQDVLTHSEEAVYDVLWNRKNHTPDRERTVRIGYGTIAKQSRVTKRNVVNIVQRLREKGFIEELQEPDYAHAIGATYRVFGYGAILEDQRRRGRTHFIRTGNGIGYAVPIGLPVVAGSASPVDAGLATTVDAGIPTTVDAGASTTVDASTTVILIDNKSSQTSSSSAAVVVVEALRTIDPGTDDDGALQIIAAARQTCPDATDEEIAHFIRLKGRSKGIKQPLAFLRTAVPKCLQGESLRQYRHDAQQAREAQEQRDGQQRAEWQRILDDPQADEEMRNWAREALGLSRTSCQLAKSALLNPSLATLPYERKQKPSPEKSEKAGEPNASRGL